MTCDETDRLLVVRELIDFSRPVESIQKELAKFEWDYDSDCVQLKKSNLTSVLKRYLNSELSALDIECWANCIEGRDDICYDAGSEQIIENLIYEFANPTLTQLLNSERAKTILDMIDSL